MRDDVRAAIGGLRDLAAKAANTPEEVANVDNLVTIGSAFFQNVERIAHALETIAVALERTERFNPTGGMGR